MEFLSKSRESKVNQVTGRLFRTMTTHLQDKCFIKIHSSNCKNETGL